MRLRALAAALLAVTVVAPTPAGAANGSVIIRSRPSGAAIVVDGAPQGQAPRTLDLPAGKHTIVLSLKGYLSSTNTIVVRPGPAAKLYVLLTRAGAERLRVRVDLDGRPPPGRGTVTVTTDPPGLDLYVDGERVSRQTPVSFDIGPGTYRTVIKYQETELLSTSTVVKEGWRVQLKRTLKKEVAAARGTSAKPGADDLGTDQPRGGRKGKKCKCTPHAKLRACVEKKRACKLGKHDSPRAGAYALCYRCPRFRRLKKRQKGAAESACDTRSGRIDDCVCRDIVRVVKKCLAPQESCLRRCGGD